MGKAMEEWSDRERCREGGRWGIKQPEALLVWDSLPGGRRMEKQQLPPP